jgi:hypothetical protein
MSNSEKWFRKPNLERRAFGDFMLTGEHYL